MSYADLKSPISLFSVVFEGNPQGILFSALTQKQERLFALFPSFLTVSMFDENASDFVSGIGLSSRDLSLSDSG